jgi:hypothetical protein
MDPLTALAAIKKGVTAGKRLHNLSKEIAGFFAYQELRKIRREVIAQRKAAERQAEAEREKFQEDVNTILIILTPLFICTAVAYFALHLSGRI